jgi:hypothetical protein
MEPATLELLQEKGKRIRQRRPDRKQLGTDLQIRHEAQPFEVLKRAQISALLDLAGFERQEIKAVLDYYDTPEEKRPPGLPAGMSKENWDELLDRAHASARRLRDEQKKSAKALEDEDAKEQYEVDALNRVVNALIDREQKRRKELGRREMPQSSVERVYKELYQQLQPKKGDTDAATKRKIVLAEETLKRLADAESELLPELDEVKQEVKDAEKEIAALNKKLKKLRVDPQKHKGAIADAEYELEDAKLMRSAAQYRIREIEGILGREGQSRDAGKDEDKRPRQRRTKVWSAAEKRAIADIERRKEALRHAVRNDPDRVDPDHPERGVQLYPREVEEIEREVRNERGLRTATQGRQAQTLANPVLTPEEKRREIRRRVEHRLDVELARARAFAKANNSDPKAAAQAVIAKENIAKVAAEVTEDIERQQKRARRLESGETVLTGVGLKVFIDENKLRRTAEQRQEEIERRLDAAAWQEFGPAVRGSMETQVERVFNEELKKKTADVAEAVAARTPFMDDIRAAREQLEDHRLANRDAIAERKRLETKVENAQEKDKAKVQSKLDAHVSKHQGVWEREEFLQGEVDKAIEASKPADKKVRDAQAAVQKLRKKREAKVKGIQISASPELIEKAPQEFKDEVQRFKDELRPRLEREVEDEHEYLQKLQRVHDTDGLLKDKIEELEDERRSLFSELQDSLEDWHPGKFVAPPDPALAAKIERYNEVEAQMQKLAQARELLQARDEPTRDPTPLVPALTNYLHEVGFNRRPDGSISMDIRGYFDPNDPDAGQGKLGEIRLKLPTHEVTVVDEDAPVVHEDVEVPVYNENPKELGDTVYEQVQTVAAYKYRELDAKRQVMLGELQGKDEEEAKVIQGRIDSLEGQMNELAQVAGRLEQEDVRWPYERWREASQERAAALRSGEPPPYSHEDVENLRMEFRDAYFGDEADDGDVAYGLVKGGDAAVLGAPGGQRVKSFSPSDGSDLDTGRSIRAHISRMRGAKPGDSANAYSITVGDVTRDTPALGYSPRLRIGTETKTVERVPTKKERQLVPLDEQGRGRIEIEVLDHNGKPIAAMPVEMELDEDGEFRPTPESARQLRTARGRNTDAPMAVETLRKLVRAVNPPNPDDQPRWPKGTPWQPKGPGPGRFRADVDIHILPAVRGMEIQAAPHGTDFGDVGAIRAAEPEGVKPSDFVMERTGDDDLLGAALAKAQQMIRRGASREDVQRSARVILHGSDGPRHIRDLRTSKKKRVAVGAPGEFTSMTEGEPLQEGFATNLFVAAQKRIRQAHSAFQLGAMKRLYPDLAGTLLEERYELERERDEEFLSRMESRLRRKIEAAVGDPNLTATEKAHKARVALDAEKRYFRRHLSEAAWRMARNAEMIRLKEAGESGAYWLMDKGLKSHTTDCLAMEGRVWPWTVLDVVNPANRHPGCGCKLISEGTAIKRGLPIKKGYQSASWREAIADHAHFEEYNPNQPRDENGRWVALIFHQTDVSTAVNLRNRNFDSGSRSKGIYGAGLYGSVNQLRHGTYGPTTLKIDVELESPLDLTDHGHGPVFEQVRKAADELFPGNEDADKYERAQFMRNEFVRRGFDSIINAGVRDTVVIFDEKKIARIRDIWEAQYGPLTEFDPDQARWPKGHPWGGRWREMERDLNIMVGYLRMGDKDRALVKRQEMVADVGRSYAGDTDTQRDFAQSLGEIWADALNPTGARPVQGEGVPHHLIPRTGGLTKGWAKGRFKWNIDGSNPAIKRIEGLEEDSDGAYSTDDLALARTLEIDAPELVRKRLDANGVPLNDTSRLNVAKQERGEAGPIKSKKEATAYLNVDYRQVGDAGEEMFADFAQRMRDLGRISEEDQFYAFPSAGGASAPLDWIINGYAIEVKASGFRGEIPNTYFEGPGIHADHRAEKLAELERLNKDRRDQGKEPLQPMLVTVLTDLDSDLAHIFAYEYSDAYEDSGRVREDVFTGVRIPKHMVTELFDGTLAPGDVRNPPRRGAHRKTLFVGSFRLRYNPLKKGNPEKHISREESMALQFDDKGELKTGIAADIGVQAGVGGDAPSAYESQQDQIIALAIENLNRIGNADQVGIAKKLGVNQATVSRALSPRKGDPPEAWVKAKQERAERIKAEKDAKKKPVGRPKGSKSKPKNVSKQETKLRLNNFWLESSEKNLPDYVVAAAEAIERDRHGYTDADVRGNAPLLDFIDNYSIRVEKEVDPYGNVRYKIYVPFRDLNDEEKGVLDREEYYDVSRLNDGRILVGHGKPGFAAYQDVYTDPVQKKLDDQFQPYETLDHYSSDEDDDVDIEPPPPSDEVRRQRLLDMGLSEPQAKLALDMLARTGMRMDDFTEKIEPLIPMPSDDERRTKIKRAVLAKFIKDGRL